MDNSLRASICFVFCFFFCRGRVGEGKYLCFILKWKNVKANY